MSKHNVPVVTITASVPQPESSAPMTSTLSTLNLLMPYNQGGFIMHGKQYIDPTWTPN